MFERNRRVVVITGATSGIGIACAKRFVKEGDFVYLIGRNTEAGQRLEDELDKLNAKYVRCDVSSLKDIEKLRTIIERNNDHVDVLFNNAGIMLPSGEIEKTDVEDWEMTFQVNVQGMFQITRALKSLIIKSKGCIINNASIAGMHSYVIGRSYAYSASKSAVIQFSRQMAKNYAEEGVRVNCICPGIIDTPILGERDRKEYEKRIPLGRIGKPEDIANIVAFLASEDAYYITGTVIPVDGGVSI